jgi:hypothetical protein
VIIGTTGIIGLLVIAAIEDRRGERLVDSCHNPSSHGEFAETDKTAKEQRQKKTPDSLERDSGEDEIDNVR